MMMGRMRMRSSKEITENKRWKKLIGIKKM
jgi:hypothetical protein